MQVAPQYQDAVQEVIAFLSERVKAGKRRGVQVMVDPGIGFGKRLSDNLELLAQVRRFHSLGAGVVVGTSRKSFLAQLTNREVADRLAGSLASGLAAAARGADVLRVHDVAEHVDARTVSNAIGSATATAHVDEVTFRSTPDERMAAPVFGRRHQVFAQGISVTTRIGVGAAERAQPQVVLCDLNFSNELSSDSLNDELGNTVDYAAAIQVVQAVAAKGERKLLETLSEDLRQELRLLFPGWEFDIRLTKPAIAEELDVGAVGVHTEGI